MRSEIRGALVSIALCLAASPQAVAQGTPTTSAASECYTTFYQTKDAACLDTFATVLGTVKPNPNDPADHANAQGSVGFLAVIFANSPEEKDRFLKRDVSDTVKSLYIEALYRAGLPDDAKAYADSNKLSNVWARYQSENLATIATLHSRVAPSDNDLLIGAYMASGDTDYIKSILENFSSIDDAGASDAFRMALMQGKFGGTLAPPGRTAVMAAALCTKYNCKTDARQFLRLVTLSSAFWSLQSLARQDQGIKKSFDEFFESDARLKRLLTDEETAFSNYVTLLVAYAAVKDNPNINASLSIYENLGTGQQAVNAMKQNK